MLRGTVPGRCDHCIQLTSCVSVVQCLCTPPRDDVAAFLLWAFWLVGSDPRDSSGRSHHILPLGLCLLSTVYLDDLVFSTERFLHSGHFISSVVLKYCFIPFDFSELSLVLLSWPMSGHQSGGLCFVPTALEHSAV